MALREIEARVRRELDDTAEGAPEILRRCKDEMAALAARHERAYTELFDRVDDALAAQQARPPQRRPDTPERRAARERNERYGRGYPTGGFSSH